jgi:hypothetical protein
MAVALAEILEMDCCFVIYMQTGDTADVFPQLEGIYSVQCKCLHLQKLLSHSWASRPSASQAIQLCCIALYGPTIPLAGTERM